MHVDMVLFSDGGAEGPEDLFSFRLASLFGDFLDDDQLISTRDLSSKRGIGRVAQRWVRIRGGLFDVLWVMIAASDNDYLFQTPRDE